MVLKSILLLVLVIGTGNCAKILCVAPSPAISHFIMLRPLLIALAERGHQVTVLSKFPLEKKIPNYTDIDLRNSKMLFEFELKFAPHTLVEDMEALFPYGSHHCNEFAPSEHVQKLLQTEPEFDLIFLEAFNTDCYLGFVAKYKAPFIVFNAMATPLWQSDWTYNPTEVTYLPDTLCRLGGSMNFYEKLKNVGCHLLFRFLNWQFNTKPTVDLIGRHFGVQVDNLDKIRSNVSLVLVNSFQGVTGSRPFLPNILEVGGIHLQPPKPLPKSFWHDLQSSAAKIDSREKKRKQNNEVQGQLIRVFDFPLKN